ncbi:hypothetical protein GCM10010347_43200 [Streptomyces cirratus]|uniref:Uncharacterized protein n=1 Tax=Streptomyces cirratus TaxID=68187 RepID=A0ABQ3EWD6_9ACTN|nr:hypothetical protein GCM10010347_43200 [Streptomyces cirratus]
MVASWTARAVSGLRTPVSNSDCSIARFPPYLVQLRWAATGGGGYAGVVS